MAGGIGIDDNGNGTGQGWGINGRNEGQVFAVSQSEAQAATELGDSYNINTGDIGCAGDTTLIYFKNDEDQDVVLEAFAVGVRGSTVTDMATVTLIFNPTGGDLITDATAVDMKENRKVGNSKTLKSTTLAYKGKVSGTITGGSNAAQFYMSNNSRLFANGINIDIPRGNSIALKITNTTTGGNAYAALVLHVKDGER